MRVLWVALFLVAACTPAAQPTSSPPPTASQSPATAAPTASPIAIVGDIAELRSSVGRRPLDSASQAQLSAVVAAVVCGCKILIEGWRLLRPSRA